MIQIYLKVCVLFLSFAILMFGDSTHNNKIVLVMGLGVLAPDIWNGENGVE